ncbi:hypothetical protein CXG81DRAFT_17492 [Caulochytrium protostelioides]|uniref:Uncharacterized protein n=1 Tax=Caulochytrium protostelioides TaxID=1555241 RepID=A0A4P9XCH1_9FUNG|nr:hypothetical protein CXG81DRAFT_17492 [Caulochytrium protostelioides]|eukprot:RKP02870.1 hypothetical protein CXG81DRAFT_17492 [Caulochytrium protostelioides]
MPETRTGSSGHRSSSSGSKNARDLAARDLAAAAGASGGAGTPLAAATATGSMGQLADGAGASASVAGSLSHLAAPGASLDAAATQIVVPNAFGDDADDAAAARSGSAGSPAAPAVDPDVERAAAEVRAAIAAAKNAASRAEGRASQASLDPPPSAAPRRPLTSSAAATVFLHERVFPVLLPGIEQLLRHVKRRPASASAAASATATDGAAGGGAAGATQLRFDAMRRNDAIGSDHDHGKPPASGLASAASRGLSAPTAAGRPHPADDDPIIWLAQYLYRHNPAHAASLASATAPGSRSGALSAADLLVAESATVPTSAARLRASAGADEATRKEPGPAVVDDTASVASLTESSSGSEVAVVLAELMAQRVGLGSEKPAEAVRTIPPHLLAAEPGEPIPGADSMPASVAQTRAEWKTASRAAGANKAQAASVLEEEEEE